MSDPLAAYLRAEASRPFAWGTADCATFMAGWVGVCRGFDARSYAPEYEGETAGRIVARDIVRVAARSMRQAGVPMARDLCRGDVAVVKVGDVAACAIRTGKGWAMRGVGGLALLPLGGVRMIVGWRV